MNATASIIIGFTPFHLIPMRELFSLAEGDIHIFHPMAGEQGVAVPGRRGQFLGRCDSLDWSRRSRYALARRDIDRIMHSGKQVDLYMPHAYNPLANYAFFHSAPCRRFIYQDGILNYYDAAAPLGTARLRFRQRAKGLAMGVRYRMYAGHLSGIDARPIAGGFFTNPERIVGAWKFPSLRRLDFHHEKLEAKLGGPRDTLFLDQPIESVVGRERARELRRLSVEYTNGLGGQVYYKPHYAQGREASCDRSWKPLDQDLSALPAEWAVAKMDVANVVSFCTSALANIAMADSSIGCHATAAKLIPVSVDGRPTDLGEVLMGLGVNVVDTGKH